MRRMRSLKSILLAIIGVMTVMAWAQTYCKNEAQKQTLMTILSIVTAAQAYRADEYKFPQAASIGEFAKIVVPAYMAKCPTKDAWGNEIYLAVSEDREHIRVVSPGADGMYEPESKDFGSTSVRIVPCHDLNADIIWQDDGWVQKPDSAPPKK
jgi:hypothetical protein